MVKYAATTRMYILFGLTGLVLLIGWNDITLLWKIIACVLMIACVIGQIIYYPKYMHYKKIYLEEIEDKERQERYKRNSIIAEYKYNTPYEPKPKIENNRNNENDRYYYFMVIILIILLLRH